LWPRDVDVVVLREGKKGRALGIVLAVTGKRVLEVGAEDQAAALHP
jgi:hypothetical protein